MKAKYRLLPHITAVYFFSLSAFAGNPSGHEDAAQRPRADTEISCEQELTAGSFFYSLTGQSLTGDASSAIRAQIDRVFPEPKNPTKNPNGPQVSVEPQLAPQQELPRPDPAQLEGFQSRLRSVFAASLRCHPDSRLNQSLGALLNPSLPAVPSGEEDKKKLLELLPYLPALQQPHQSLNKLESKLRAALLAQSQEFSEKKEQAQMLDELKVLIDQLRQELQFGAAENPQEILAMFDSDLMTLLVGHDMKRAILRRLTEIPPKESQEPAGVSYPRNPPPSFERAFEALKAQVSHRLNPDQSKRSQAAEEYQRAVADFSKLRAGEKAEIKAWLRDFKHQITRGEIASKDEREREALLDLLDDAYTRLDSEGVTLREESDAWARLDEGKKQKIEELKKYLHGFAEVLGNTDLSSQALMTLSLLTEDELKELIEFSQKDYAHKDTGLLEELVSGNHEQVRTILRAHREFQNKRQTDPELDQFMGMMEKYFSDVLKENMPFRTKVDLLAFSPSERLKLARLLAALPTDSEKAKSTIHGILLGFGQGDNIEDRLEELSRVYDPKLEYYPPGEASEQTREFLKTPRGKALAREVGALLGQDKGRSAMGTTTEWIESIQRKPEADRTDFEKEGLRLFQLAEGFSQQSAQQARDLMSQIYRRSAQQDLCRRTGKCTDDEKLRHQRDLEALRDQLAALTEPDNADPQSLLNRERQARAQLDVHRLQPILDLARSQDELAVVSDLVDQGNRERLLPLLGRKPGTEKGFSEAEAFAAQWFDSEKGKARDPRRIEVHAAQEQQRRTRQEKTEEQALEALKKFFSDPEKAILRQAGVTQLDFSQLNIQEKDRKVFEAILKELDPELHKQFEDWLFQTYLEAGAPGRDWMSDKQVHGLVVLNNQMAMRAKDDSAREFELVPITEELKAETQKEVDELRRLDLELHYSGEKEAGFLPNIAAGLSHWKEALGAPRWLPPTDPLSLMRYPIGAKMDETGNITFESRREHERKLARYDELLARLRTKGNLQVDFPGREKGDPGRQFVSNLVGYFGEKQGQHSRLRGERLARLDEDLTSAYDTMKFVRDEGAMTVALGATTGGAGLLLRGLGLIYKSTRMLKAGHHVLRAANFGGRLASSQIPRVGQALKMGYRTSAYGFGGLAALNYFTGEENQMAQAVAEYQRAKRQGLPLPKVHPNLDRNGDRIPDRLQGFDVDFTQSLPSFADYNNRSLEVSKFFYGMQAAQGLAASKLLPGNPLLGQMVGNASWSLVSGAGTSAYMHATGRGKEADGWQDILFNTASNLVWASPVDDLAIMGLKNYKWFRNLSLDAQRRFAVGTGAMTNMAWSGLVGGGEHLLRKDGFVDMRGKKAESVWDAAIRSFAESFGSDIYAAKRSAPAAHAAGMAWAARVDPVEASRMLSDLQTKAESQGPGSGVAQSLLQNMPAYIFPGRQKNKDGTRSPAQEALLREQASIYAERSGVSVDALLARMRSAKPREPLASILADLAQPKPPSTQTRNLPRDPRATKFNFERGVSEDLRPRGMSSQRAGNVLVAPHVSRALDQAKGILASPQGQSQAVLRGKVELARNAIARELTRQYGYNPRQAKAIASEWVRNLISSGEL